MVARHGIEPDNPLRRVAGRAAVEIGADRRNAIISRGESDTLIELVETTTGYRNIIAPKLLEIARYFDTESFVFAHIPTFYSNKNTKFVENFAQFMNLSYICGLKA